MSLIVRYDEEFDMLRMWTGESIGTSSSCEQYPGLVVDFDNEDNLDPVGFELRGAAHLLAPFLDEMKKGGGRRIAVNGGYVEPGQISGRLLKTRSPVSRFKAPLQGRPDLETLRRRISTRIALCRPPW